MSGIRLVVGIALAFAGVGAATAQAGFAPANEALFEAEQTSQPSIASDAAGNSIVAWSQEQVLGAPPEAKARRLSTSGTLGPIVDLAPGEISAEPRLATTASGRTFVAWHARVLEADPDSVKGRWIEPNGTLGPLLTLVEGKVGEVDAGDVQVAVDPAGVATVTWANSADGSRLSLRRVQPDSTLGTLVPDISSGFTINHQIVALANGSTVAVWRDTGIEASVVDSALGFGPAVKLSSTGSPADPEIAVDQLGNALVVWRASLGEKYGAFGRVLSSTGAASGAEVTLDPLGSEFVNAVGVAADSAGDFLVTWDRQNAENKKTVLARGVDLGGVFAGPAHPVSTPALAGPGALPALFDAGAGVVAWKGGVPESQVVTGRPVDRAGLPTGAAQELFARPSFNAIEVTSTPAIGIATFLFHYPISGSAQGAVVRRFLLPPACSDSVATVVQGRGIVAPLACTGAGIEAAELLGKPRHGTVGALDPFALSFAYTPEPGYSGSDSFTYRLSNDGGASGTAQVTIAVGKETVKPRVKKLRLIRKGKVGKQRFKFRLVFSEPATARLTLKRVVRVGGKAKLRRVGVLVTKNAGTKATIAVKGKLARKLRSGGRFRAVVVATDLARNKSTPKKRAFRVR